MRTAAILLTPCLVLMGFVVAAADVSSAADGQIWHVAPDGAGDSCSQEHPCALSTAQARVRAARASMQTDLIVRLHDGTYRFATPLRLTAEDSGRNGHDVIYEAAPGARPRFSGGVPVTGWHAEDEGLWVAAAGNLRTRHLYVDGTRVRRATQAPGIPGELERTDRGFHTTSTAPQSWIAPQQVELVWRGKEAGVFEWVEARCPLASIHGDASGTDIEVRQPCFRRAVSLYAADVPGGKKSLGAPSWSENNLVFLKKDPRPRQWVIESREKGHFVHYRPVAGRDPNTSVAIAGRIPVLVWIDGAEHLVLRGIEFTETTWLGPEEPGGFPSVFGNGYLGSDGEIKDGQVARTGIVSPPAALEIRNARDIRIENNSFVRLGGLAVNGVGVQRSSIVGNVFRDISAGGLLLASAPDSSSVSADDVIANNVFDAVGVELGSSPAIVLDLTQRTSIVHNHISNTAYAGIIVNGTWDGAGHTTANRVLHNRVEGVLHRTKDGGGIYAVYLQGPTPETGLLVEGNLVRNPAPGTGFSVGIYTDIASKPSTVRGNVAFGFLQAHSGCAQPWLDSIVSERNFFDRAPLFLCDGPKTHITIRENTLLDAGDPLARCAALPKCASIMSSAGLEPAYRRLHAADYGFDDFVIPHEDEGSPHAVVGVHAGIDFGTQGWTATYSTPGYASLTHARVAGGSGTQSIVLRPSLVLESAVIEGNGEVSLSDGVNPPVTVSLRGPGHPVLARTEWAKPGSVVTFRFSKPREAVVDRLVTAFRP